MSATALIGAGIAAAGTAGSAAISNAGTKRAAKAAAKFNLEQWNRENAYNHPSQQMARLTEAGLNPNLIYGSSASGASGNASSSAPRQEVASYQAPNLTDTILPVLQAYSDFRVKRAQANNLEKQSDVIDATVLTETARALNLTQQTAESAARTARSKFDLNLAETLKQNSLDVAQQGLLNMRKDMELKNVESLLKYEDLKYAPIRRGIGEENILNMRQTRQRDYYDTLLKKYEYELSKKGLNRNDNILLRQLFGEGSFIPNLRKSIPPRGGIKQLWDNVRKNPKASWQAGKALHNIWSNLSPF